jgi:Skp family chaperone for outer membrane proteins
MRLRSIVVSFAVVYPLLLIAGGCNHGPSSDGGRAGGANASAGRASGVAVVDLDEVARQLGRDTVIKNQVGAGQATLNQQLLNFRASLLQKYQQKAHELETQPLGNGITADSQKQQLAAFDRELGLQLNQAKTSAEKNLNAYWQQLTQRFREEVIPAAKEAAAERGLGVVVTKNDTVLLAFDDAHDITAAVVERLRLKQLAVPDAATASSAGAGGSQTVPQR